MNPGSRRTLKIAGAVLTIAIAVNTGVGMLGRVRTVEVLLLFASGFGAGATLVALVRDLKERRTR